MNDGYFPLPANARRTTCRSCKAPVAWIVTESGAHMPLDLGTVEQRDGVTMALNHFATCPQGKAWSGHNATSYHGPAGDVNDPAAVAAVEQLRERQKELGL